MAERIDALAVVSWAPSARRWPSQDRDALRDMHDIGIMI